MKSGVYLVGAGPGDPKLITVRGQELIRAADAIVYDQLANPELLELAKVDCETIYVGKQAGKHTMQQDDMNQLLVDLAQTKAIVVRLKGGDPYVFGRGSEEGQYLKERDVYFEVVPGISSAIGGLAYAGIPVTAREIATSFHVITGHLSAESDDINYQALAKLNGTLVFLMGVGHLEEIANALMAEGKESTTPVAIIYKASTPEQKVYISDLGHCFDMAQQEKIKPPSLIVVGEVVNFHSTLDFIGKRPLFGKHVLVTRSRQKTSKMREQLQEEGARVTELPTIKIVPQNDEKLRAAIMNITNYDGIIFTSAVAVERFMAMMVKLHYDGRKLFGQKLIVIGEETAKALASYGLYYDYMPDQYSKEDLAKLLETVDASSYLIPRSAKGDKAWTQKLAEQHDVEVVECYDTVFEEEVQMPLYDLQDLDYITFTSSSTVHGLMHWLKLQGKDPQDFFEDKQAIVIGPTTAKTLKEYKIKASIQSKKYTTKSMVEAMCDIQEVR